MTIITWINARLKPDQARHAVFVLILATAAAHLPWWGEPWMRALLAGVIVCCYELYQMATKTGDPSLNDVAANMSAAALVALATLA